VNTGGPAVRGIYLLRHAKSSWEDPGLADHERPLSKRGRTAAKAMADHIRSRKISPELVLCSSAVRARQTLEAVAAALGNPKIEIERDLYSASAGELLGRIRALPQSVRSVLLVGHNPAIQELALTLSGASPGYRRVEEKFPTGALATFEVSAERWSDLSAGDAALRSFVAPKDLA
jgi:phosphohistidine phosphatase